MPETKERNKEISRDQIEAKTILVDIGRENIGKEPVPREIKTWMEKVEQASSSQPQQVNDDTGQPLLTPFNPQDPKIVLPVTRKTFVAGFKKTWLDASRWLSVFLFRFIKIKKGNVTFKSDDNI
ncbi:MAG: hypothetical protein US68_C0010G0041 [Candidatus Shapirobacteria bacterium GW2011_GWE1_38_10]|uniref:Uncharacterized protein n=1 Tax=Candidatus Shapirobacteria bacterium GW2011_GWE1_38_10 TaxID=1618488 RepID=A0A0G0I5R7_9BACT|nr:MAG: hypothetical protein US46_C0008G0064 [Candidatus Shapirobacteria bacterium GW2011_GWF2_37_20]KKQ49907.1 MAG: hypothetical protein US68_C0010G0041 [Candidatus Shapirobacteria bacterium GW2011_GWE1_38_10]KKQ64205.1 MAG: hypothetical protein US85_C0012G0037 [Candidatus Shapirobacteria bacterium GW2011_GWF1_38_23]HBP51550.1 hypothetical protein [Candidatus Shapirobacteria bacterium]